MYKNNLQDLLWHSVRKVCSGAIWSKRPLLQEGVLGSVIGVPQRGLSCGVSQD